MASLAQTIIDDDFVWVAVASALAGRKRKADKICCPVCVLRGETADRRFRCGIRNNHPGVTIHCFNCAFKTEWKPGDNLSRNLRQFMGALGVPDLEIKRLNHKALVYRQMIEKSPEVQALIPISFTPNFPSVALPAGAMSFEAWASENCDDPDFIDTVSYLFARGDEVATESTFYWTPNTDYDLNRRVIIPLYRNNDIVGWTARAIDGSNEKRYHSHTSLDYLFNNHWMEERERKFIILVEGIFDALSLEAVGTMGSGLNDRQAIWLESTNKTVIVLPDRDKGGEHMIDVALKYSWHVAFPALSSGMNNWWDNHALDENGKATFVKDAADAVKHYGRLYTLCSILKTATNNPDEINLKRKLLM